jgi:hypothetical protein
MIEHDRHPAPLSPVTKVAGGEPHRGAACKATGCASRDAGACQRRAAVTPLQRPNLLRECITRLP